MSLIFPVAVREAIMDISRLDCGIKWPNDIVYKGCKLCGILTESIYEFGGSCICIGGVGVNTHMDSAQLKGDLAPFAATIPEFTGNAINLNELASAVLNRVSQYMHATKDEVYAQYVANCVTLGSETKVFRADERFEARAESIGRDGSLKLRLSDGSEKVLYSGEVSVRGVMGYI